MKPTPLHLQPLAPYEDRLLAALAFFRTKRNPNNQARHCLSMYLRQSESRIMAEVGFYAERVGMNPQEFLELIYRYGDRAEELIEKYTDYPIQEGFDPEPENFQD